MELIIIGVLFVIQLLTLFWITILNTKLSKFKDLEQQQQKVIEEMDNSIGAYLLEMKDENDRLLQEIQQMNNKQLAQFEQQAPVREAKSSESLSVPLPVEKPLVHISKTAVTTAYEKQLDKQEATIEQTKVSTILNEIDEKPKTEVKPKTFEEKVKQMYNDGLTIEQIAKNTNKGKTEIELLLKFSS